MKAIGYYRNLPISDPESLIDLELPDPQPGPRDLLAEVHAVSVNPVDVKVRARTAPENGEPKVIGWDASGVVRAVGRDVTLFKPGDRVWYAGSLLRPGTNSELHVVDERIVGRMPQSLNFAEAAALPLTSITAWELLFDRLGVPEGTVPSGDSLLVIGAAGGVGSILVQLARRLTGLTVIGTASRPETSKWVSELGAHHVIDHTKPLSQELKRIGMEGVDYIASLNQTDRHFDEIVASINPQGHLALIDDPELVDFRKLKTKSVALHWEFMFTRSMFGTKDQIRQHDLLERMASLIDEGVLRTTLNESFGTINAANLRRAHELVETNRSRGKLVLEGF
ncbi:zinc-binding alcohol dehydrogenase family protein [Paraburkholderia sp. CNPSo 3076]|uniref:zinc-binding alcohol dehydrogenase family protein n=1 Tax=Paraburkholderia sp. CNPSo 3076 TaxID=2940936 RepID=UPI002251DAC4|nr:zinc-binding alcohol dehydrogenase family protein [Paraburkholderia sp. CNPSo 3076]MCX5542782.1 zinc-binding alcohol dehydrogenase family protein [Paraburkholderia sp. CNPSo 3076]